MHDEADDPLTCEEAVLRWRKRPEDRQTVLDAYVDSDPLSACERLAAS
jgi:hypothetical protein